MACSAVCRLVAAEATLGAIVSHRTKMLRYPRLGRVTALVVAGVAELGADCVGGLLALRVAVRTHLG